MGSGKAWLGLGSGSESLSLITKLGPSRKSLGSHWSSELEQGLDFGSTPC